jgi:serine acetyltransferase
LVCGIDANPATLSGRGFMIDYGSEVVIDQAAMVEHGVSILGADRKQQA